MMYVTSIHVATQAQVRFHLYTVQIAANNLFIVQVAAYAYTQLHVRTMQTGGCAGIAQLGER